MRIFTVYLESFARDKDVFKTLIPAETEEAAIEQVSGNGEIIAIKDTTTDHRFDTPELWMILEKAGYDESKIQLLDRLLENLGLATE